MDFDFIPDKEKLTIPKGVYQDAKTCLFCHSFYLTDTHCESCGRRLDYDEMGAPFSHKSYYIMKEKYLNALPFIIKLFPFLEDKKSIKAKNYLRQLHKRRELLSSYLQNQLEMPSNDQLLFKLEYDEILIEISHYEKLNTYLELALGQSFFSLFKIERGIKALIFFLFMIYLSYKIFLLIR